MPIQIIRQDITKIRCDAIVNPTNSALIPSGGTDEAIHAAAGPKLAEACAKLSGCALGQAVITYGYNLPCKYIIHTVGPVWKGGTDDERTMLESCYTESLRLAKKHKCRTVAFPLISSGTYGYPKDQVLKVAMETISAFLHVNEMSVTIAVYDRDSYALSRELANQVTAYIDDRYTGEEEPADFCSFYEQNDRRRLNRIEKAYCEDSVPALDFCEDACPAPEMVARPSMI